MTGLAWTSHDRVPVPLEQARIPFAVPGVMFGESLFETVRVRRGRIFRLGDHIERLTTGLKRLGWAEGLDPAEIYAGLQALLSDGRLSAPDLRVRVTALRLDDAGGILLVITAAAYRPPDDVMYRDGVAALVAPWRIEARSGWTAYKSAQRAAYRFARAEAQRAGVWEALVCNTDGYLADGAITNVYIVRGDSIVTPPVAAGALPGITRRVLREIADELGLPWNERPIPLPDLFGAGEAFLTNALVGVLPLVRVDERQIGGGRRGPVTRRLQEAYVELVERESQFLFPSTT